MGPNQLRIMDEMASRLSVRPQESFIKTDTMRRYSRQRLIGFCVYVSVVVRRFATGDVFRLFAVNILNLEASFGQNMEATITSLRLRVRQGRCTTCCVDLL